MHSALFMILQAAAQSPRSGGRGMLPFVIQMIAIMAIFYFLLIRPQRKLAAKHQELLSNLAKNDEVVTEGGIIGTVIHIQDDRITLRTAESTRIVVLRAKIARVLNADDPGEPAKRNGISPGVIS
jgi:preprotein translocase subunit YajC